MNIIRYITAFVLSFATVYSSVLLLAGGSMLASALVVFIAVPMVSELVAA